MVYFFVPFGAISKAYSFIGSDDYSWIRSLYMANHAHKLGGVALAILILTIPTAIGKIVPRVFRVAGDVVVGFWTMRTRWLLSRQMFENARRSSRPQNQKIRRAGQGAVKAPAKEAKSGKAIARKPATGAWSNEPNLKVSTPLAGSPTQGPRRATSRRSSPRKPESTSRLSA